MADIKVDQKVDDQQNVVRLHVIEGLLKQTPIPAKYISKAADMLMDDGLIRIHSGSYGRITIRGWEDGKWELLRPPQTYMSWSCCVPHHLTQRLNGTCWSGNSQFNLRQLVQSVTKNYNFL